jgi:hypothetical protein
MLLSLLQRPMQLPPILPLMLRLRSDSTTRLKISSLCRAPLLLRLLLLQMPLRLPLTLPLVSGMDLAFSAVTLMPLRRPRLAATSASACRRHPLRRPTATWLPLPLRAGLIQVS